MLKLKNDYISVLYESGPSFGGSQRMADNKTMAQCGCGVVAATDFLLYITKHHGNYAESVVKALSLYDKLPKDEYNRCIDKMRRIYFPLIPKLGMNGLGLMAGMQLYFHRYKLPYSCHWCISDKDLWQKIAGMLSQDLPVIMSIGPNFPFVWRNGKAAFYTRDINGALRPASYVKAHFVSVTGMDNEWLEISSWGQRFYLNRRMYEEYVSKYSAALVSNILLVKRK